jgi:transcriptional regulator with XRE-family HTH domain
MPRHLASHIDSVEALALRLNETRRRTGLSQRAVARGCGFTPAYLSRLEKGERVPSLQLLVLVARFLSQHGPLVTGEYLARGEEPVVTLSLSAVLLDEALRVAVPWLGLADLDHDERASLVSSMESHALAGARDFAAALPALRTGFQLGGS